MYDPVSTLTDGIVNTIESLISLLEQQFDLVHTQAMDAFLSKFDTGKWILASDYRMSQSDLPVNVMSFALIPYTTQTVSPEWIRGYLPRDLKDSGDQVSNDVLDFLRRGPFFVFNFILDCPMEIFPTAEMSASAIEATISVFESSSHASEEPYVEWISKLQLALRDRKKKSFKKRFNQVALLSALGTFVALHAARRRPLEFLSWSPDQDDMIGIWQGLAHGMFQANLYAFLQQRGLPDYRLLQFFDEKAPKKLWYDPYIRIPDHFASPIASLAGPLGSSSLKSRQILNHVVCDNPRVANFQIAFPEGHIWAGNVVLVGKQDAGADEPSPAPALL